MVTTLERDLKFKKDDKKAFMAAATEIAANYNPVTMMTEAFLLSGGNLFDPRVVSTYSRFLIPPLPPPPPPKNSKTKKKQEDTRDRTTELVCRNVIVALLGNDVDSIYLFLLTLLLSCKKKVDPTYAISSMKNALLGVDPAYDIVFQVRLDDISNLVDDDDESDWIGSDTTNSSDFTSSEGDASDSMGESEYKDDAANFTTEGPLHYNPARDDAEFTGLPMDSALGDEFLHSSLSNLQKFITTIGSISNAQKRIIALLRSVVGFLISQVGECKHPDFVVQPSVNLICADTIKGIAGSGQALIVIFLMSALLKGFQRVCLELASNVMNIAGLCLYSKFFKVDYDRLLHEDHPGTLFYSPGNLPMSMELGLTELQKISPTPVNTQQDGLNVIKMLCTKSTKHMLCSIDTIAIPARNILNAQREAAATQFMLYLVETIGKCIGKSGDQWRDGKSFLYLIADAVRNALGLQGTLQFVPDPRSADRSMTFCDRLKNAVLIDPGLFDRSNCYAGPDPANEDFNLDPHQIQLDPNGHTSVSELQSLYSDLNVYLQAIKDDVAAIKAAKAAAAAAATKLLQDATAGKLNQPISALVLRNDRLDERNKKKEENSSNVEPPSLGTVVRAGHDVRENKQKKSRPNGGGKKTKNKRKKNKPKTKRRAANKKNKKAHAGRVSRHNKVFRRKTRKSK